MDLQCKPSSKKSRIWFRVNIETKAEANQLKSAPILDSWETRNQIVSTIIFKPNRLK